MFSSKRNPADRKQAVTVLQELLRKLGENQTALDFAFRRHGDNVWQHVTCGLDNQGQYEIRGDALWTQAFYAADVRAYWGSDAASKKKPWLSHRSGLGVVFLHEYIAFACDPSHPSELRDELSGGLYSVMSQLAYVVECNLSELAQTMEELPANWGPVTNVRRMSPTVAWEVKCSVSQAGLNLELNLKP